MPATLYNIGKPRALGHAIGCAANTPYMNPYPRDSKEHREFTSGFFEGNEESHLPPVIIAPEIPGEAPLTRG